MIFKHCVRSRSACSYVLKNYVDCLTDIELALEAGYPNHMVYKLYIRQCKCLLELTRIPEAQEAFDKAIDAIDRSGMKKDMRIGITADLQEAFINLAKSCEENPMPQEIQHTSNVRYTQKRKSAQMSHFHFSFLAFSTNLGL